MMSASTPWLKCHNAVLCNQRTPDFALSIQDLLQACVSDPRICRIRLTYDSMSCMSCMAAEDQRVERQCSKLPVSVSGKHAALLHKITRRLRWLPAPRSTDLVGLAALYSRRSKRMFSLKLLGTSPATDRKTARSVWLAVATRHLHKCVQHEKMRDTCVGCISMLHDLPPDRKNG